MIYSGEGMTSYHAVVTREFPFWKLTLTGGDLPESGHVMTSMSFVRLEGDMHDWLHWHHYGATPTYWPVEDDLNAEDDTESGGGDATGFGTTCDCRWPKAAKDALERYFAARKTLEQARHALGEPICTIADELEAEEEDVARLVGLPVEEVMQIMLRHRKQEDWRERREQRESES